ncbi:MAG: hypothetical protein ACIAQZ_07415 [Sedimentisphaeraceae bacterium JB056]
MVQTKINMELRILRDGKIVLVAPDGELLEAVETITANNQNKVKESIPNDNSSSETASQEKNTQRT